MSTMLAGVGVDRRAGGTETKSIIIESIWTKG